MNVVASLTIEVLVPESTPVEAEGIMHDHALTALRHVKNYARSQLRDLRDGGPVVNVRVRIDGLEQVL